MLTIICGTRPEAIKLVPVLREAKRRKVATRVILTGQHTDLMLGTGIRYDLNLNVPGTNEPESYVETAQYALQASVPRMDGIVVVQGDTASALAGARWGTSLGLPVAHVEAGLRSHDLTDPYPEEGFRVEIDRLATYHFCPTEGNLANLKREGWVCACGQGCCPHNRHYVTGNTIVDQLRHLRVSRETPHGYVLVTLHRRESFGDPLKRIVTGLKDFALSHPDTAILWPMHPNPRVREALQEVPTPVNVMLRGPLPYESFLTILSYANCVLTDSGGVVEEATTLGVPVVCARTKTERPEAFERGCGKLVGRESLAVEEGLRWGMGELEDKPTESQTVRDIFGDGKASERIMDVLTGVMT